LLKQNLKNVIYFYFKASPNLRIAAIFYFLASFVVLMLGLIGYFGMHRMEFYKYYSNLAKTNSAKSNTQSEGKSKIPYLAIIKKVI
jgi:hypothetical protein